MLRNDGSEIQPVNKSFIHANHAKSYIYTQDSSGVPEDDHNNLSV